MKHIASARKNCLGYWVGCVAGPLYADPSGHRPVTNAFDSEGRAIAIAERMAEAADRLFEQREARRKLRASNPRLYGRTMPGEAIYRS